jgi:glycine/D-amino acid oxidase-like deaminating enzyme
MNRHAPLSVDVAVVGGGIVGCATAYWLTRHGVKVAVFERATIASEQSSRAWGFIREQGRHGAEVPLAAEAKRLWTDFTQENGWAATELTQAGILVPAESEIDEQRVEAGYKIAQEHQLRTRILTAAEISGILPELHGKWRCALFTPNDGHGEPATATKAFARKAAEAGARFFEGEGVADIDASGAGEVRLSSGGRSCNAGAIVLACGIGTRKLARSLGLDLPVQIIRSSVAQTAPAPVFTKVACWAPRVAFRPKADGSFYIGNGYRGAGADYDLAPDSIGNLRYFLPAYKRNRHLLRLRFGREFWSRLRAMADRSGAPLPEPYPNHDKIGHNLDRFRELFPHLGTIALAREWAGRIDLTPDVVPIVDRPLPSRPVYVACGFSGHGFALGPSVGKQLAEWIVDGRPSIELRAFRYSRFAEGDVVSAPQAL